MGVMLNIFSYRLDVLCSATLINKPQNSIGLTKTYFSREQSPGGLGGTLVPCSAGCHLEQVSPGGLHHRRGREGCSTGGRGLRSRPVCGYNPPPA